MNSLTRGLLLTAFALSLTPQATAGDWKRLDAKTISFEGDINEGELEKLKQVYTDTVTTLKVNSPGGLVSDGLELGSFIRDSNLEVVVEGLCLSSCANYIFTSGSKKHIKNGMVCFHGNLNASGSDENEADMREQLKKYNLPEDEVAKVIEESFEQFRRDAILENEFFGMMGISQELFERTQKKDKGMGDGKEYHFLCPKPATFEKYGIKNVRGSQNIKLGEAQGMQVVVD